MKRTTITLDEELVELVEHEARRRGSSVSGVIRELVARGLGVGGNEPRAIPWAGLFSDPETVTGRGLDDELAEGWADAVDRDRR